MVQDNPFFVVLLTLSLNANHCSQFLPYGTVPFACSGDNMVLLSNKAATVMHCTVEDPLHGKVTTIVNMT